MTMLKSFGDGIGTAAGVAWPFFGILSGSLSLSVGSSAAIALGTLSCGIFVFVAIPIALWSFKNYRTEQRSLFEKYHNIKNDCARLINVLRELNINNQAEFQTRDVLIHSCITRLNRTNRPIYLYIKPGLSAFFAGFGTILGCSAGALGLLVQTGLFIGISAVPIIGWIALGSAILFGIILGGASVYHTKKNLRRNEKIEHFENLRARMTSFIESVHTSSSLDVTTSASKIQLVTNKKSHQNFWNRNDKPREYRIGGLKRSFSF